MDPWQITEVIEADGYRELRRGDQVREVTVDGVRAIIGKYGHGFFDLKSDHECLTTYNTEDPEEVDCPYWHTYEGAMKWTWKGPDGDLLYYEDLDSIVAPPRV